MIIRRTVAALAAALLATTTACSSTTSGAPATTAARSAAGSPGGASSVSAPRPSVGAADKPFHCSPSFVTSLHGFPVARQVAHYPVPDLHPDARHLAGQQGIAQLRQGELDVVYNRESTGLAQGPSKAMFDCFVRYAGRNGWKPDAHMNQLDAKQHRPTDPLLSYFYDSGSRYRGGNELTVRWFTSKQYYGLGNLLSVIMQPNGFLPDLHPPK